MHAYSLEEINSMLMVFPEPARTAFAVAAHSGLRRGEIEGLEWTDCHDGALWVSRSIWNGRKLPTKTKKSNAPRLPMSHGWHAARRGLGTNLYRLGVPDKIIQAILRHSNVNLTLGYYIKLQSADVVAAMGKFEAEIAAHQFRDSKSGFGRDAQICKLAFSERLGWSRRSDLNR